MIQNFDQLVAKQTTFITVTTHNITINYDLVASYLTYLLLLNRAACHSAAVRSLTPFHAIYTIQQIIFICARSFCRVYLALGLCRVSSN